MSGKMLNGPAEVEGQDGDGVMNGNVLTSSELNHNFPVKEGRVIKKAKRPSKQVKSAEAEDVVVNGAAVTLPPLIGSAGHRVAFSKNSRKSRNAKGRGIPKKGK